MIIYKELLKRFRWKWLWTVFENVSYEGYNSGAVAIVVEGLTDNRNRTVSSIKSIFDKNGGNLGVSGCFIYVWKKRCYYHWKTDKTNEDDIMQIALEAGMDDMEVLDDSFYITTAVSDYNSVYDALKSNGYEFVEADIELVPNISWRTWSRKSRKIN